jgi:hypothetical protein
MFESIGILRYSPTQEGIKSPSKWWLVVDTCEDLIAYYRHWWNWEHRFFGPTIVRASWKSHISVVTDEVCPNLNAWGKYAGEEVRFTYEPDVRGNAEYFWIDVRCERLLDIREELGLSRNPTFSLHLTLGKAGLHT